MFALRLHNALQDLHDKKEILPKKLLKMHTNYRKSQHIKMQSYQDYVKTPFGDTDCKTLLILVTTDIIFEKDAAAHILIADNGVILYEVGVLSPLIRGII